MGIHFETRYERSFLNRQYVKGDNSPLTYLCKKSLLKVIYISNQNMHRTNNHFDSCVSSDKKQVKINSIDLILVWMLLVNNNSFLSLTILNENYVFSFSGIFFCDKFIRCLFSLTNSHFGQFACTCYSCQRFFPWSLWNVRFTCRFHSYLSRFSGNKRIKPSWTVNKVA